jgi:peptidylprolyl isomerase
MMGRGRLFVAFVVVAVAVAALSAQAPTTSGAPLPPDDVKAPPASATKTASGLAYRVLMPGSGEQPKATDVVTIHYTGWTADGTPIDTSRGRTTPSMFPLDRTLPGFSECVQQMRVGESRRCWLHEKIAYAGRPGRPRGSVVFDIELIETRTSPRIAPPDVAAAPADAERTGSGLAFKILKPGTGARNPSAFNRVVVHYTGWTTDGKMFDSSVARGAPATLSLDQVIPGWTEGMQLMVEGERRRFWIPQELAYKGEAGSPRGMLVFDVDLIRIE